LRLLNPQQTSRFDVFRRPADGSGAAEALWSDAAYLAPRGFSADGTLLVVDREETPGVGSDLWILPLDGSGQPFAFMETPFDEYMATFSPDGRFLAYQSDESGRDEVYVRAFPGPGGRWQVSTEGGVEPRWSGNGSEIFYRTRRRLYAVEIDTSAVTYSVSHDGRYVCVGGRRRLALVGPLGHFDLLAG